jgi:competence protein ComEA
LIGFKEKISRIRFFIERIRYSREKHFFGGVFIIIIIVISITAGIYFHQKNEIKVKENILKSYYDDSAGKSEGNENVEERGNSSITVYADSTKESVSDEYADNAGQSVEGTIMESSAVIKAYICGCVFYPGVYELNSGSRLIDLLNMAGGADSEACLEVVNLAVLIKDQDMAYIPSRDEILEGGISVFEAIKNNSFSNEFITLSDSNESMSSGQDQQANGKTGKQEGLININTAPEDELRQLPGIGEIIAGEIVTHRENFGQFTSIGQIKNVKGIGEKKFESIKDLICI